MSEQRTKKISFYHLYITFVMKVDLELCLEDVQMPSRSGVTGCRFCLQLIFVGTEILITRVLISPVMSKH